MSREYRQIARGALWLSILLNTGVSAGTDAILPSYPLAVKSPYLSAWAPGNNLTTNAATTTARFWNDIALNWPVLARVDGQVYSLFGTAGDIQNTTPATTDAVSYTSTHTLVSLTAGSVDITLDFFTPVYPGSDSYVDQSLPYSFLTVSASSKTYDSPQVQMFSGIDQTWTGQRGTAALNYSSTSSADYFQFNDPNAIQFTERDEMARYGSVLYGSLDDDDLSHTCGQAASVYADFVASGSLLAPYSCNYLDLAAFAKDLGKVDSEPCNVTFAIGLDRVNAVNFVGESQTGLYRSKYPDVASAISYVLENHENAVARSDKLDKEIRSRSEAVSSVFGEQYADIVEASIRQSFAALELTVPLDKPTANPWAFMKEISSNGDVNTIDLIFQSWPIYISLNPSYIRFQLEPILSILQSGQWPQPWVIHDIGLQYPNATGHPDGDAEQMPLFETSSLFILMYAYQTYSGDTAWAQSFAPLLKGYADYLVNNSLYPASQYISVDAIPEKANQTGLAVQCAIGLRAAGKILDDETYSSAGSALATELYDNGLGLDGDSPENSTHFTYFYGSNMTWNVLFAAYSDVLLKLDTFPSEAYEMQSRWYEDQLQEGGLPFSNPEIKTRGGANVTWGLTDWNIMTSGIGSADLQAKIVNTTHAFMTSRKAQVPFGTKYEVYAGPDLYQWLANKARSTVGTHLSLLALDQGMWGLDY